MQTRDFRSLAYPDSASASSSDGIPDRDSLRKRRDALISISEGVDLIQATDDERGKAQGPITADEAEMNALYARFAQNQATVLTALGLDPTLLADAVAMDVALVQLGGALTQVEDTTRSGAILLAAELTQGNDQIEEVAAQVRSDPTVSEHDRLDVKARFTGVVGLREDVLAAEQERQARARVREARQQALLEAEQQHGQRLLDAESLRSAPLPAVAKTRGKGSAKK